MTAIAIALCAALAGGLLARAIGLPPLVGFLVAGFGLGAFNAPEVPGLELIADLGVTLLLFGVGLKLDARLLLRREVWLTALLHMALSIVIGAGVLAWLAALDLPLLADAGWETVTLVAFGLSFSSTVLVVKVLDIRSDSESLYGTIAIGVLIIQDVVAVGFISTTTGEPPSPWAALLILLLPAGWVLRWILGRIGHGELPILYGVFLALVPGWAAFQSVHLEGDLGAVIVGMLLAGHERSHELARSFFGLKELLLVGFFLSIGMHGGVSWETMLLSLLLLPLLLLKALGYYLLLRLQRFRVRTGVITSLTLTNFSEFGLIVAAVGVSTGMLNEAWLSVIAVTLAISFVISTFVNRRSDEAGDQVIAWIGPAKGRLHPRDQFIPIGHADAVVMGMGRIGRAAYDELTNERGMAVVGIEHNPDRAQRLLEDGYDVLPADATDSTFWERLRDVPQVDLVVLAMPFHGSNLEALDQLQSADFRGTVVAIAQYDDEVKALRTCGVHEVVHLYQGAGTALAEAAAREQQRRGKATS